MKARFVYESLDFERGRDTKDALKIGRYKERQWERAFENFQIALNDFKKIYNAKIRVINLKMRDPSDRGIKGIIKIPELENVNFALELKYFENKEEKYQFNWYAYIKYKDHSRDSNENISEWQRFSYNQNFDGTIKKLEEKIQREFRFKNSLDSSNLGWKYPSTKEWLDSIKHKIKMEGLNTPNFYTSFDMGLASAVFHISNRSMADEKKNGRIYMTVWYNQPDIFDEIYPNGKDINNLDQVPGWQLDFDGGATGSKNIHIMDENKANKLIIDYLKNNYKF